MLQVQSPTSLAISRAVAEAELRRMEMSRSLPPHRVVGLLRSQAEAASKSPLAYDQLLALALDAVCQTGEFDSTRLDALRSPPDPMARHDIAKKVFAHYSDTPFRALVKAAPDWELRRASRRVGKHPQSLAGWLRSAAQLARELWDHPSLPVEPAFRGAMLACVTSLQRRADELAPRPAPREPARPLAGELAFAGRA